MVRTQRRNAAGFDGALDLVGLATVCDVVPLVGVNRAFVRGGLAKLSDLKRKGFAALARVSEPRRRSPLIIWGLYSARASMRAAVSANAAWAWNC